MRLHKLSKSSSTAETCSASRVDGARREKLEAKATAAALRSAASQAELLIDEVAAQKGTLADTPAQWRARLRGVASVDNLISGLRDLETQLNVLGDGLPKGTHPRRFFLVRCMMESWAPDRFLH